jgi:histidinol dehydrogenase
MIDLIIDDPVKLSLFLDKMKTRGEGIDSEIPKQVAAILQDVKQEGDAAVARYTEKFDHVKLSFFEAEESEKKTALDRSDPHFVDALQQAADNIRLFHRKQIQKGWELNQSGNIVMGQRVMPLKKVGIYVPGGTAAYPSTVLMNAIPAKIAGVEEIIMVTPPDKNGTVGESLLAAAQIAGVDRIFKVGGAQAIAALAYGTDSIPSVDKIVGPGNIYVATAKQQVYGTVDIDMFAGPSEILIIADDSANPSFLAADLMSQAEHDILASSILLTTSKQLARLVCQEIERQVQSLERKQYIRESLRNYGAIIVTQSMQQAIDLSNELAPEHLELCVEEPFQILDSIVHAGSVFLGHYSPEPLGDYFAGTNHVLPTNGTARFFSPLSVDSFIKKSSYLFYSEKALLAVAKPIQILAKCEGLTAHANSIEVRLSKFDKDKEGDQKNGSSSKKPQDKRNGHLH